VIIHKDRRETLIDYVNRPEDWIISLILQLVHLYAPKSDFQYTIP